MSAAEEDGARLAADEHREEDEQRAGPGEKSAKEEKELEKLGLYSSEEARASRFARILMLGPSKAGKTTSLVKDAPKEWKPLIINCDGADGTGGAAALGGKFAAIDADSRASWKSAQKKAQQAVAAGVVNAVIVDSLTLLCDNLVDEISLHYEGFDLWNELDSCLRGGCKKIMKLDAHVVFVAHMVPAYKDDDEETAGLIPLISGQSKAKIPALVSDVILFEADSAGKRQFILGPQKKWTFSGRHITRACKVPANIGDLFDEMGIDIDAPIDDEEGDDE